MKGAGWIVVLLGLLGAVYLVGRDLRTVTVEKGGKVVVEPLQQASRVADLATRTQKSLDEGLKNIDK